MDRGAGYGAYDPWSKSPLVCLVLLVTIFSPLTQHSSTAVIDRQRILLGCIDRSDKCADYAKWGQCETNERYMLQYCCKTCKDKG